MLGDSYICNNVLHKQKEVWFFNSWNVHEEIKWNSEPSRRENMQNNEIYFFFTVFDSVIVFSIYMN